MKNFGILKQNKFFINWRLSRTFFLIGLVVPIYFSVYNLVNDKTINIKDFVLAYIFTVNVTFVVAFSCSKIMNWLVVALPWEKGFSKRLTIELILTNINSSFWVTIVLFLYKWTISIDYTFQEDNLASNVFDHIIIAIIINTTFVLIIEGNFLLKKWRNSLIETEKIKTEKERLEKENILAQFQALKNQVNPHFLFNSLSVLGSLIQTDQKKAEEFVSKFSKVYRYVLDVKEDLVVELSRELDFVKSYFFYKKYVIVKILMLNTILSLRF